MNTKQLVGLVVLLAIFSVSPLFVGTLSAADDKIVARVKDVPIKDSELSAHMADTRLPRDEALSDLVDQKLLRIIAADNGVEVPAGPWDENERIKVETAIVKALSLPIPPYAGEVVVDHAYFKLPQDEEAQKAGLALMERLRALVVAGADIPAAYSQLQVDGTNWHIGDHEEYPASALPDETRELPVGGLTKIISSSDGYNLFKIHERKIPVEEIRQAARIYLLEKSTELVNILEE